MDILLVFVAIIAWVVSAVSKLDKRQDTARRPGHQRPGGTRLPQPAMNRERQVPDRPISAPPPQRPESLTELSGTIDFAEGDDQEGWRAATWNLNDAEAQSEPEARAVSIPGLGLSFDGDSVVGGVIYAEILGRRPSGRRI